MPRIPDEQFAELKRKNPGAVLLYGKTSGHDLVVLPPSEAAWMKWQTTASKGPEAYVSTRQFLFDCLVFPDKATVDALIEQRPGLLQTAVKQLTKLAGSEDEIEVKS